MGAEHLRLMGSEAVGEISFEEDATMVQPRLVGGLKGYPAGC